MGFLNINEEEKRSSNTNKESKDSIDKINKIINNGNLKKVVVSETCVACGICTLQTNLLKENPDGKVIALEPGIVSEENISLIERVISECPVKAISLVKCGLVNAKGKEGLKELIEFIKNKLYNYKIEFPLPEEYEFNKTEFQTPTAYGRGEYSYEYSSDDKAMRAGLREFDRVMYSQRRAIIQQLLVEYKTKKLNKYSCYEDKKDNFYYSTNRKIENLLKEIIEEAKELSNNILFPQGFEKLEVIPKFGIDGDEFNKELNFYQLRHIEELWFVQEIMNELESLNWYDTYIDTDYMEDYRGKDVYCYKNINDVCNKFGEHLINEFPYVLNGSDGIRKVIEAPINTYIELVNKEIKVKADKLIDLIERSLKSKSINNVNLKSEAKEPINKIKKDNKSKNNIKNFKSKRINYDGEKYWCICPHCEVNKIVLEGIILKNISKKIYFKKPLKCDLCEGVVSSFINPIIVKQPKSVFFKCINTNCNHIIEVNGKNCTEYNNKIIFDIATKCTLCGTNIGEIEKKSILDESAAKN